MVIGGIAWSFFYLKDIHPLGSLGLNLGKDHLAGVAIRFKDAKLVGRAEGKKVWEFEAETIDLSKDRQKATFSHIKKGALLQDGKPVAAITSDKVIYNTFTRNLEAPTGAQFTLTDGPSFKLHKVAWDAKESKLRCDGGISATLGQSTMQGERMVADLKKKEVTIAKVKGQIKLEE